MTSLVVRLGQLSVRCLSLSAVLACQNEYPLDPTPCDYWCAATERPACGKIDPADCVALCEKDYLPVCENEFRAAYECMAKLPDSAICLPGRAGNPCEQELTTYFGCRTLRESGAE